MKRLGFKPRRKNNSINADFGETERLAKSITTLPNSKQVISGIGKHLSSKVAQQLASKNRPATRRTLVNLGLIGAKKDVPYETLLRAHALAKTYMQTRRTR